MKLHSLTDTPSGCVTYHSLTVDLPLQRYFLGFFTRVSTCICIRLHHFSNRGESRTVHGCGVVLDLILMRWFVSSVSGFKKTHTHTHTHTHNYTHAPKSSLDTSKNKSCIYRVKGGGGGEGERANTLTITTHIGALMMNRFPKSHLFL